MRYLILILALVLMAGCASVNGDPRNPRDREPVQAPGDGPSAPAAE